MHCCVTGISCIQGSMLYPVSCKTPGFSQLQPWMLIILTCTHLVLLSISNEGSVMLAKILPPQSVVLLRKYPPPSCISYALVQATAGVGTVFIWYLI